MAPPTPVSKAPPHCSYVPLPTPLTHTVAAAAAAAAPVVAPAVAEDIQDRELHVEASESYLAVGVESVGIGMNLAVVDRSFRAGSCMRRYLSAT